MDKTWDDRIKQTIKRELDTIEPSAQAEQENLLEIHRRLDERRGIMKFTKRKMIGAIAATIAIVVLGTATVVAASKIKVRYDSKDNSETVYSAMELSKQAGEQMKTAPKLVDTFSNGLAFKEGCICKMKGMDENKKEVTSYPEVDAQYGKNRDVGLFIHEHHDWYSVELVGVKKKEAYKGITLVATEDYYLDLPNGTLPSEVDLKLEKEGILTINYGSSKEEREVCRSVVWSDNGMEYSLCTFQDEGLDDIGVDDLICMAKEVIDVK